jgi:hypothetical protein
MGYGLQGLDSSVVPRELLVNLAAQMKNVQLKPQEIGNVGYGLQGLDSSVVPRELLVNLAEQMKKVPLTAQAIGNVGYGLQGLDSSVVPRELLVNLAAQMKNVQLDPQHIGNMGYGVQGLDSSVVPRELLANLAAQMKNVRLDAQSIGNVGYGLLKLGECEESAQIKSILNAQLERESQNITANPLDIILITRTFSILKWEIPLWLKEAYQNFLKNPPAPPPNNYELIVYEYLKNIYPEEILRNYLIDGIEIDLYLPEEKLAIEIDGGIHLRKGGRDSVRDAYLQEQYGITTQRVKMDLKNWKNQMEESTSVPLKF